MTRLVPDTNNIAALVAPDFRREHAERSRRNAEAIEEQRQKANETKDGPNVSGSDPVQLAKLKDLYGTRRRLSGQIWSLKADLRSLASRRTAITQERVYGLAELERDTIAQLAALEDSKAGLDREYASLAQTVGAEAKRRIQKSVAALSSLLREAQAVNDELDAMWSGFLEAGLELTPPPAATRLPVWPIFPALRRAWVSIEGGKRQLLANRPSPYEAWAATMETLGFKT